VNSAACSQVQHARAMSRISSVQINPGAAARSLPGTGDEGAVIARSRGTGGHRAVRPCGVADRYRTVAPRRPAIPTGVSTPGRAATQVGRSFASRGHRDRPTRSTFAPHVARRRPQPPPHRGSAVGGDTDGLGSRSALPRESNGHVGCNSRPSKMSSARPTICARMRAERNSSLRLA